MSRSDQSPRGRLSRLSLAMQWRPPGLFLMGSYPEWWQPIKVELPRPSRDQQEFEKTLQTGVYQRVDNLSDAPSSKEIHEAYRQAAQAMTFVRPAPSPRYLWLGYDIGWWDTVKGEPVYANKN